MELREAYKRAKVGENIWQGRAFVKKALDVKPFIDREYKEFVSLEGLMEFATAGNIDETGLKLQSEPEDIPGIVEMMKSRLHNTLDIVNTHVLPLSENWSITVVENEFIILVPYLTEDKIIFISEKNVVRAFSEYFRNIEDLEGLVDDEIILKGIAEFIGDDE